MGTRLPLMHRSSDLAVYLGSQMHSRAAMTISQSARECCRVFPE